LLLDSLGNINDIDVTPKIIAGLELELRFNLSLVSLNQGSFSIINHSHVSIINGCGLTPAPLVGVCEC
jgi:hypothetical protein